MFSGTKVFDDTKNIQQQKQIIQRGVANASLRFYYINLTEYNKSKYTYYIYRNVYTHNDIWNLYIRIVK